MNKKKIIVLSTIILCAALGEAHEFWLQPNKFFFKVGETTVVDFKVGENFMGEPWDLTRHKVDRLELNHLQKVTDYKTAVKSNDKEKLKILLEEEGTHMLVMQSNDAFMELEGAKFNEYLKEDGLDDVYQQREKAGTLDKPSKEFYSRHTKLLLQVGDKRDDTFNKRIGLPIEIIPDKNPYLLKLGDVNHYTILWQGKPLFGARVKVWNRYDNRTTLQNIFTEKNGKIEVRISNPGPWMISVVKMIPSTQAGADWQSYWGSFVFGVQ
jgi:uncharacterized GH25 family protein